jgi:hypothetical protein
MCKDCLDIVNMSVTVRDCTCGKVQGRHCNAQTVEITATGPYIVLKLDNADLLLALSEKNNSPVPFKAEVLPEDTPHIYSVNEIVS